MSFYYTDDVSKLNHHLYSAGILPYQIGKDGLIYVLLGKDRKGYWSDFGGKCDLEKDGSNIKYTAARELFEESYGCLMTIEETKKMLVNEDNYIVINSQSNSGISYYMFLLKVPLRPKVATERFKTVYNYVNYINANYSYLEKTDIKWFSLDTLLTILDNKNDLGWKLKDVFKNTVEKNKHEFISLKRNYVK